MPARKGRMEQPRGGCPVRPRSGAPSRASRRRPREGRLWQRNVTRKLQTSCSPRLPEKLPPAAPASSEVAQKMRTSCPSVVERLPRVPRIGQISTMFCFCLRRATAEGRDRDTKNPNVHWSVWATFWPRWAKVEPSLAGVGQIQPKPGHIWHTNRPNRPKAAQFGQNVAQIDQSLPNIGGHSANTVSAKARPKTANVGRIWAVSRHAGQLFDTRWVTARQLSDNFGPGIARGNFPGTCGEQVLGNFRVTLLPDLGRFWPVWADLCAKSGRVWARFGQRRPNSAQIWPTSVSARRT